MEVRLLAFLSSTDSITTTPNISLRCSIHRTKRGRYGVGAWLARKRALTEGSTSSRQGSTTGLVHELLQRYQHELAGDVGAALVRAYVGPR